MKGFTDKPTMKLTDDSFEVKKYINGLSSFILECDTPMTIAIQGDWGSGKTSMMNMIKEEINEKIVPVWFNTWQYSQFNMSEELSLSLLNNLIEAFDLKDEDKKKMKKTLHILGNVVKKAALIGVDRIAGGEAVDGMKTLMNKASREDEDLDIAKAISRLKVQFQECVNSSLIEHSKDRVVIFIDDLDRLQPSKAVELLEVLKLFLDGDNCVFVLAIDYEVVSQGVKQKYGSLLGEEKGKSFFDKIIQVPFKMPIAQYDVVNYVTKTLDKMAIQCTDEEVKEVYVNLIRSSIGCNPRSMKRLFNSFFLLNKIAPDLTKDNEWNKKVLFAVLCLQLSYEKVYNYIVNNRYALERDFLSAISDKDRFESYHDAELLKKEFGISNDLELNQVLRFMKIFNQVIDKDKDNEFSVEEINDFIDVLGYSTITAATDALQVEHNDERGSYRRLNRQVMKDVNKRLYDKFHAEFAVYQSNDDRGDWKFHDVSGYKWLWKDQYTYALESALKTDLVTKQSRLSISIVPKKETTWNQLFKVLDSWNGEKDLSFIKSENDLRKDLLLKSDSQAEMTDIIYREVSETMESLNGFYDRLR